MLDSPASLNIVWIIITFEDGYALAALAVTAIDDIIERQSPMNNGLVFPRIADHIQRGVYGSQFFAHVLDDCTVADFLRSLKEKSPAASCVCYETSLSEGISNHFLWEAKAPYNQALQ